jgi:predicted  nucleic acid-binding Zn-ribbon protein
MAQRKAERARTAVRRAPARKAERRAAEQETLASVRAERDRLRMELEAARARIAGLEQRQREVLNRIDWIVDSLNSLMEGRT